MASSPDSFLISPDRMEEALEAAGVGVWEMNLGNREFTCSARCKQVFGFAKDARVQFENLVDVAHPQDRDLLQHHIGKALEPGGDGRLALEYRIMYPDGQERWVRSTGATTFDPATGAPLRFQGVTRDITEAQLRALHHQQHLREFQFLAESVPEILWMARPDGSITYYNQRWQQYTGQPAEQAQAWGWQEQIHPDDLPLVRQTWEASVQAGTLHEVQFRLRRTDGEYRWFLGRALPLRDEAGYIQKWCGTCTDIHEQVLTLQRLRQHEQDLAHSYSVLENKVQFRTAELERQVQEQAQRIQQLELQGGQR